jgi:uncharacterized protein YaiI (UPF0178 family)
VAAKTATEAVSITAEDKTAGPIITSADPDAADKLEVKGQNDKPIVITEDDIVAPAIPDYGEAVLFDSLEKLATYLAAAAPNTVDIRWV